MKVRDDIKRAVQDALRNLGLEDEESGIVLERPREATHGDISTPVAMSLAKQLRRNPLEIAQMIATSLSLSPDIVSSVEVLKPGFINFRIADPALRENLPRVVEAGDRYGSSQAGVGTSVLVEYVSANPTGPLVVVQYGLI